MIDVWILGGYLGAGKTTALNQMLDSEPLASASPALIINEFGKIGVDGALVERRDLSRFEINKGSLFCICTKTDFLKALADIADSGKHKAVLIEATGIAEPVDIENFLNEGPHAGHFRMRGNICIVDALNFTQIAAYLKPATSQVRWADAIVINKCDLVEPGQLNTLRNVLRQLNPAAPITETTFGKIEEAFLKTVAHRSRSENLIPCAPEQIFAVSFATDNLVRENQFKSLLKKLEKSVLRLKGNIAFDAGDAFVEVVCGKTTKKAPVAAISAQNLTATAFTVILWNIDKETAKSQFESCWSQA
jgi:G3E family GTPase